MKNNPSSKSRLLPALSGAAFLMATSAIGPGFITQTTVFTQQLFTSFGCIILLSIVIDMVVQLNIWRIVAITRKEAPAIANQLLPGLGWLLVLMVAGGGLVFNVGNIGGCGLALNTLFGLPVIAGSLISCALAIIIFLNAEFGKSMDRFAKLLGFVMIALTLYTALSSHPPIQSILRNSIFPSNFDIKALLTVVGGTVGGYISFAGAHRMLDASKINALTTRQTDAQALQGILVASLMRMLLFTAAAGVVGAGVVLSQTNPAADVFKAAAGTIGIKIFGLVLWAAAITSVVGAAYTSVSFLQTLHPLILQHRRWFIIGFILLSTAIFSIMGNPVSVLVKAGTINGFVLPLALAIMLLASRNRKVVEQYRHPLWLTIGGWMVVIVLGVISLKLI